MPCDVSLDIPDGLSVPELEGLYNAALRQVASAAAAEKRRCGERVALLGKALRAAKRRSERTERPEWSTYPELVALPRCPEDARYVQSFGLDDAQAVDFFQEYGFVVFRDVLDAQECEATVAEIWASLEERTPGLRRQDRETWHLLSSERYGLPEEQ
ncbi:unnamed protein product, partial [Effrenium voratum]